MCMLKILYVVFIDKLGASSCVSWLSSSYCIDCFMQSCGHLLGKGLPFGSLVCDIIFCFVLFLVGVLGQV